MTVMANVGEGSAHETKGLVLGAPFDLVHPFNRLLIENIAAYAVHGVGRITDNATVLQNLNRLSNQPRLGIGRIYCYYFRHTISICTKALSGRTGTQCCDRPPQPSPPAKSIT
jgi:hypothetical protein